MSRPSSMSTRLTMRPPGPVCGVTRFMPRMWPAIAAAAGMNLGLDYDHVGFQALRRFARFFLGVSDFAARSGHAVARENRFGLILVNLHRASISARICASAKQRSVLGRRKRGKDAGKWPRTQLFF